MGREFELKFAAKEADLEVLRRRYPHLTPIAMETAYYDTPEGKLGDLRWTLRRRFENGVSVCTLKTPAGGHGRNEWEVRCGDIRDAIGKLVGLGAPKELEALTAPGLTERCGAKFTRLCGLIQLEEATVELALDKGILTGGGRELPLCEIEAELKEGSEEAVIRFGKTLAGELGLEEEPRSKVARAIALAQEK